MNTRKRTALGVLLIFALVLLVYSPILPGNFLMDDYRLVKDENALVNGQMSPLTIWFQTDFTLSAVAWWLQWLAWGDHPAGYHVVNLVLHALSAVLLWRLLVRLKIPGAWFAAAIFAVHPVCVNSVARISEVKNTLSLPFFILSFWAYLRYEETLVSAVKTPDAGRRDAIRIGWWYGLALVAFVLALLGKTSTVMLPVVLIACAAWQRRRMTRQDWLQTGPFFFLALAFGLMSIWFQKHQALAAAGQTLSPESLWQRIAIAGHVICFYLGKALLPIYLNIVYPRWKLDGNLVASVLPVLFLVAVLGVCWRFRHTWGRGVLFGLGCFILTLFPVLGFFDSQFLVKWQVSDHLQYLPLMAPVALVVASLAALASRNVFRSVGIALLMALSVLTFQRARVFASEETLFQDTLAKNPAAADAHNDLGVILAKRQNYAEAMAHFATAVQLDPQNTGAQLNLGRALAMSGKLDEAQDHFLAVIQLQPNDPVPHVQSANVLMQEGKSHEAVVQFTVAQCLSAKPDVSICMSLATIFFQIGEFHQAADQYRKALSIDPNLPEVLNNLAWLLATCSDNTVRDGAQAVEHAEASCRLTGFKQTGMISTLAAAYAEAGRYPEAVTTAELAIKMQTTNGETQFAAMNTQLLELYRAGMPYHEPPPPGQ